MRPPDQLHSCFSAYFIFSVLGLYFTSLKAEKRETRMHPVGTAAECIEEFVIVNFSLLVPTVCRLFNSPKAQSCEYCASRWLSGHSPQPTCSPPCRITVTSCSYLAQSIVGNFRSATDWSLTSAVPTVLGLHNTMEGHLWADYQFSQDRPICDINSHSFDLATLRWCMML